MLPKEDLVSKSLHNEEATTENTEEFITPPCHLSIWPDIKSRLEVLQNVRSPTQIIQILHDVRILVQETQGELSDRERAENVFKGLRKFLFEEAQENEIERFLHQTFPGIINWALQIENLFPECGIRFMKQQQGAYLVNPLKFNNWKRLPYIVLDKN